MKLQPYLFFDGRCDEAIAFYTKVLGAKVEMVMHYKDSPEPLPPGMVPPGSENKVMHASMQIGDSVLMVCDDCSPNPTQFKGFSLSLNPDTKADAERMFAALADQGTVVMPLNKTFWSSCFGMLTDRFGVGWMINVES
jgi:PhnB protein